MFLEVFLVHLRGISYHTLNLLIQFQLFEDLETLTYNL